MANELPNAVALMRDDDFRAWLLAASIYQARLVIIEPTNTTDHAVRLDLALLVIADPQRHLERFVNVIAADPQVAVGGATPEAVTQEVILTKISEVWTHLAKAIMASG